jgi:hypothetical protein
MAGILSLDRPGGSYAGGDGMDMSRMSAFDDSKNANGKKKWRRWDSEEERLLGLAVVKHGNKNWEMVAKVREDVHEAAVNLCNTYISSGH